MRTVTLVALVGCTTPHLKPTPPPVVVAARPPVVAPAPVADVCISRVYPWYSEHVAAVNAGLKVDDVDESGRGDGGGGRSWDEKRDELEPTPDAGVCDIRHRGELEADIAKASSTTTAAAAHPWDRKTPLAFAPLVTAALALTPEDTQHLARDGFVVPARLEYPDYASAFYDIHRGQLPIYISADAILHSVFASHDAMLASLESTALVHALDRMLGAMACALPALAADYPPEVARDLDIYLAVARSFLGGDHVPPTLDPANAPAVDALVDLVGAAGPRTEIELFGRKRAFDPNAFTIRGHYTQGHLGKYFQAAMWISRVELNLVSRDTQSSDLGGDRAETPREDIAALALADLVTRSHADADLAILERAWTQLAGKREDVSMADLGALRAAAHIPATIKTPDEVARAATALRAAIGTRFVRTINTHPNPNVTHLPAIASLLGPRVVTSSLALSAVVSGRGPDATAGDIGAMLGVARGTHYSPAPATPAAYANARAALAAVEKAHPDDLYSAWLGAIDTLGEPPKGRTPSFMDTDAYADLRLDTAVVAFGQITHNHVLLEAQLYDQGGCEIPDGYVEPNVALYRALSAYAARGKAVYAALDPGDTSKAAKYYTRAQAIFDTLAAIAADELAGRALTQHDRDFLAMVVETREATAMSYMSEYPIATYDGWYIDLFPSQDAAFHPAGFVVDYATFQRQGREGVKYLGATGPRLGIFAVDTGGGPRMMVGPVAHGFEATGPLDTRFADEDLGALGNHPAELAAAEQSPWTARYTVAAPPTPAFTVEARDRRAPTGTARRRRPIRDTDPGALAQGTVRVTATTDQGPLTIELLDHHFVKVGKITSRVGAGKVDLPMPATARPVEAIRVVVGAFTARVDLGFDGSGQRTFGSPEIPR